MTVDNKRNSTNNPFYESRYFHDARRISLAEIEARACAVRGVHILGPYENVSDEEIPGKPTRRRLPKVVVFDVTRSVLFAPEVPVGGISKLRDFDTQIFSRLTSSGTISSLTVEESSPTGKLAFIHREYHETIGVETVVRDGNPVRIIRKIRFVADVFPSLEAAQAELARRQNSPQQADAQEVHQAEQV